MKFRGCLFALLAFLFFLTSSPVLNAANPETGLWTEVDRLGSEQKFQAALDKTFEIRKKLGDTGAPEDITEAIIRAAKLRMALHGYETSVKELRAEKWPAHAESRVVLELYAAHVMMEYHQIYQWEIRQREKTVSSDTVDLKAWTSEQIGTEISKSFDNAMKHEAVLSKPVPESLVKYISKNQFPPGVRPVMRDAVVYLAVRHLSNTQYWTPAQSAETYMLKIQKLFEGDGAKRIPASAIDVHPVERLASWLNNHKAFHLRENRPEGAMEAQYELLSSLHERFDEVADKREVLRLLTQMQLKNQELPWWSRGQGLLADLLRLRQEPGVLILARQEAIKGRDRHPESYGGKLCAAIAFEIETPSFNIETMRVDGSNRPSLEVNYKNLTKMFFRAYRVSVEDALSLKRSYGDIFLTGHQSEMIRKLTTKPVAEWSVDFAPTPDYSLHKKMVTPPLLKKGFYVFTASTVSDGVTTGKGVTQWVRMSVSDLILQTESTQDGALKVRAINGDSGLPIGGAKISLYRYNWEKPSELSTTVETDKSGYVTFTEPTKPSNSYYQYLFVGKHTGSETLEDRNIYFGRLYSDPQETNAAFLFTDRSVYRPQQKIFWKAVAFSGNGSKGLLKTVAKGTKLRVQLLDPNYQQVASADVSANEYGTASGEFLIPTGRPLGGWIVQLHSGYHAQSSVRVEEYKRPTFEASILDATEPLRLNRPTKIRGEAKYYFGLPVNAGSVKWRITRQARWPWWWGYYGRAWVQPGQPQTVASGIATLTATGNFEIPFTPKADERKKADEGVTFDFVVDAEITDEGGETRSGQKSFRIGFVSVEAMLSWDAGYFRTDKEISISTVLKSLDGKGKKGTGKFKVARLKGPEAALAPAAYPVLKEDLSRDGQSDFDRYGTPDDRKRARWDTGVRWESIANEWPEEAEVASGTLQHDDKGNATALVKPLSKSGVYRITYDTKDDFGTPYKVSRVFVVTEAQPKIPVPLYVAAENSTVEVGSNAKFFVHSGIKSIPLTIDVFRSQRLISRRDFTPLKDSPFIEIPMTMDDRGGFTFVVYGTKDYQHVRQEVNVGVPWTDRGLTLEYSTFRDRMRPGAKEKFKITVKGPKGEPLKNGPAEVLSYMYDRSLDIFGSHSFPSTMSLYPSKQGAIRAMITLGSVGGQHFNGSFPYLSRPSGFSADELLINNNYGIGGAGRRRSSYIGKSMREDDSMKMSAAPAMAQLVGRAEGPAESTKPSEPAREKKESPKDADARRGNSIKTSGKGSAIAAPAPEPVRENFSETAFFKPHLLTESDGSVSFEFTAPESVTSWSVYAHAMTKDMRGGYATREVKTVKELMVRPYAPRFLREGDTAEIKVSVNNAGNANLAGQLTFDIENVDTGKSALAEFGLKPGDVKKNFEVQKDGTTTFGFPVKAPRGVAQYAFRVLASAKGKGETFTDGELRPFPLLPSRMHLAQSRFVTLKNKDRKVLEFKDLAAKDDATLENEKMVVTVDAQLFYGVLKALPYLVNYPYECTEQTLNRFLATGVVSSLYAKYPAVEKMAKEFSARNSRLDKFDEPDPNRRMTLEESPWLQEAKGGADKGEDLLNVLDSRVAKAQRDSAVARLKKMQLPSGAFPWFEGGPPDSYMTLYALMGFGRALEFKVDVPKDLVQKAWKYTRGWLDSELQRMMADNCCWEFITMVNYAVSLYPDESWSAGLFDRAYRTQLLNYSFRHWKNHAPLLKGYLALTLLRMDRKKDAELVWDSVMDSSKSDDQLGTYWAPEDRSWLWYNDTIETHAFSIRTLMELDPKDKRMDGLVQWLFLNKKMNHWKSTRATSEAIYALVHYLDKTRGIANRESITVDLGTQKHQFNFEPDKYTGAKNQVVVAGDKMKADVHSKIAFEKSTPGHAFTSATWHFSTDRLPKEDRGDFFHVSRRYFKRENTGKEWVLKPLKDGEKFQVGDQVEVQISLSSKHEAEYVHLRDPRAAGLEPENVRSGYRWDLGIYWFEEIRDSGTNFFFSKLPVGEYTFKYRLRANMAGVFRVGPATVQSMYAPEFNAYSAGDIMSVQGAK